MKNDFTDLRVEHQTPVPHASSQSDARERVRRAARRPLAKLWVGPVIAIAVFGTARLVHLSRDSGAVAHVDSAAPQVLASKPLVRELNSRLGFLGQFSAMDEVELRAQVGGTLTENQFQGPRDRSQGRSALHD